MIISSGSIPAICCDINGIRSWSAMSRQRFCYWNLSEIFPEYVKYLLSTLHVAKLFSSLEAHIFLLDYHSQV